VSELAKLATRVLGADSTVIVSKHSNSNRWYATAQSPLIDIRVHNRKTRKVAVGALSDLLLIVGGRS
jgi:hypothetical protein